MARILVVDDEADILNLVKVYIEKEGHEAVGVSSGADAIGVFKSSHIDLVVMDVMMEGISGLDAAKEILSVRRVPVIMLTAISDVDIKLECFDFGIVDYMVKPFSPRELMARIRVSLQRYSSGDSGDADDSRELKVADMIIDIGARSVRIGGDEVGLSFKEFELLMCFVKNAGKVLSRRDIMDCVWNGDRFMDERVVDSQVKLLRKKIRSSSASIVTYRSVGYKFTP